MPESALELVSLRERPDLLDRVEETGNDWPVFIVNDPVSIECYEPAMRLYPDLHLIALRENQLVARIHAVPIQWSRPEDLSERGWDWALGTAVNHPLTSREAVSLIEIRIAGSCRGQGLSGRLLAAVWARFAAMGVRHLVGPVRPNGKAAEPRTPPPDYLGRVRADGLPADAWLRVHVRLGGRIVKVAPLSMVVPGTLEQWRAWTGLPFDRDGLVDVPGALAPVMVDLRHEHAVYIEPNVWVHHPL